jgi:hypothetical protein
MIGSISSSTAGLSNIAAMRQKMFSKMDADGNGSVSKDEFLKAAEKMQAQRPKAAEAQNMPSPEEIFKQADTNGDGSLSKDEFAALTDKMDEQRTKMGGPGGKGGAKAAAKANNGSSSADGQNSQSNTDDPADTNGDGTVSLEERLAYNLKINLNTYNQVSFSQENDSATSPLMNIVT